jgi:hypothetical protein
MSSSVKSSTFTQNEVKKDFIRALLTFSKVANGDTSILKNVGFSLETGVLIKGKNDKNYHQFNNEERELIQMYCVGDLAHSKVQSWDYDDDVNILAKDVKYNPTNITENIRPKVTAVMNKIETLKIIYTTKKYSSIQQEADSSFGFFVIPKLK